MNNEAILVKPLPWKDTKFYTAAWYHYSNLLARILPTFLNEGEYVFGKGDNNKELV